MKVFVVLAIVLGVVSAVQDIKKCRDGSKLPTNDAIKIGECDKPPCILKRGKTVKVDLTFKPDANVKNCTTSVFGIIGGIPLPFIGVDETDCCPDIYNTEGKKVGCPLVAGQEYVYKNAINILPFYPKVSVVVEWQLLSGARRDNIMCFQVNAKITS